MTFVRIIAIVFLLVSKHDLYTFNLYELVLYSAKYMLNSIELFVKIKTYLNAKHFNYNLKTSILLNISDFLVTLKIKTKVV